MSLIHTIEEWDAWRAHCDRKNKTLGFVPTMGCLHDGHLSLIRKAKEQNDLVVVSVFVNPTQFGPGEDYEAYPRDIARDARLATEAGADVVFNPAVDEIYLPGASAEVEVKGGLTQKLCGASRPTHFKGVTTAVSILFHIIQPDNAYFGQKDAQQVAILRKMVRDLHIPVHIVVCPIVREADGLAKSSRNLYLTPQERQQATALYQGLQKACHYLRSGAKGHADAAYLAEVIRQEIQQQPLAKVDYVEILDCDTLDDIRVIEPGRKALAAVAVRFGKTRLIDNAILTREEA